MQNKSPFADAVDVVKTLEARGYKVQAERGVWYVQSPLTRHVMVCMRAPLEEALAAAKKELDENPGLYPLVQAPRPDPLASTFPVRGGIPVSTASALCRIGVACNRDK